MHEDTHDEKHEKCMACECPCDEHKEHNHPVEHKKCEHCGHEHHEGGHCDCGCK